MNKRKVTKKKKRRRKRQSKTEHFFGAVIIEGLGVLAVIAMFVYARRASQPEQPVMAEAPSQSVVRFESAFQASPANQVSLEWREPNLQRFDQRMNQASYFPASR